MFNKKVVWATQPSGRSVEQGGATPGVTSTEAVA
jgi:hypothetical protein